MPGHPNARVAAASAMRYARERNPDISWGDLAEIAFKYAPPRTEPPEADGPAVGVACGKLRRERPDGHVPSLPRHRARVGARQRVHGLPGRALDGRRLPVLQGDRMKRYRALDDSTAESIIGVMRGVRDRQIGVEALDVAIERLELAASELPLTQGAVSAARVELLAEVTAALRSEGYIYRCYGPRAADFIDARFGGQSG